jgi:hypothetical protein
MGFFKAMKDLFQGKDLTGGSYDMPMNRAERREQEKLMRRKATKERQLNKKRAG